MRWGTGGARWIYGGLTAIALAAAIGAILHHVLPPWYALAALALAALGLWASGGISTRPSGRRRLKQSIEMTLLIYVLGCVTLIVANVSERLSH